MIPLPVSGCQRPAAIKRRRKRESFFSCPISQDLCV
jgi:hypothetical protein